MNDNKLINNLNESIESNSYLKLVKGLAIAFIFTLVSIFIFSVILTYSSVPESSVPIVIIAISVTSILIGSTISTRNISKNGMLKGGLIGGIYIFLLYFISSLLNTGFSVNVYTIIMIITGILSGLIGGIIGINS